MDIDTVANIELPESRDTNFYKRITRSLHGLGMLKALSPIPPSTYNYEHMGQLLSILFAWLEAVAFTSHMHLKIVEIVERYQAQAIEWIKKVEKYDFELYCDCLLPLPPVQARVGLPWESLMSRTRQQLEGLQRLSVLVRYGLVPEEVCIVYHSVMHCLEFLNSESESSIDAHVIKPTSLDWYGRQQNLSVTNTCGGEELDSLSLLFPELS